MFDLHPNYTLFAQVGANIEEAFINQLAKSNDVGFKIRASQIGSCVWLQAWDKFYGSVFDDFITFQKKRKLLDGLFFEEYVAWMLDYLGYKVERQVDVTYRMSGLSNFSISGHPDFVATGEDGKFVVECKEVDDKRFKDIIRNGPGKQYEMQLAVYCDHLKLPGCWLVCNRATKEIAFIPCTIDYQLLAHTVLAVYELDRLGSFNQMYETFAAPKPVRHARTNNFYIPYYLYVGKKQLHPVVELLYNWTENEKGSYVITSYNYPDEYKDYEPLLKIGG